MKAPHIEGEIEINLTDLAEEGQRDLGMSEEEFEKLMETSGPQKPFTPAQVAGMPPACECCNRTDRQLWDGVCAWCCP